MLRQLVSIADPEAACIFTVLFLGVLRISELELIRSGDFVVAEGESAQLLLRTNKKLTARGKTSEAVHWKPVVSDELKEVLRKRQASVSFGELLFPRVNRTRLDALVKAASEQFDWPSELIFDGVHCLRHGGAQFYASHNLGQERQQELCVRGKVTHRHYTCPNVNRALIYDEE
jgi:integrase